MITATVSRKGGVGKTTTSVNLAAALAGIGKRVLLIDLDSQASASLSLGVPRSALVPSSADVILRSAPVSETIRPTRTPGLDLVTCSSDLSSADQTLSMVPGRELRLQQALREVDEEYDFILLDCPSSLSLMPINALLAADNFIVPVVPQYLASEGVRNLLSTVDRLYERFGHKTDLLGIVLTMVDYRTRANRVNVDGIRREYREQVFAVEIRTNIRLAEAPGEGQTIFEHDLNATGAKAYRLLAAEVLIRAASQGRSVALAADEAITSIADRRQMRRPAPAETAEPRAESPPAPPRSHPAAPAPEPAAEPERRIEPERPRVGDSLFFWRR